MGELVDYQVPTVAETGRERGGLWRSVGKKVGTVGLAGASFFALTGCGEAEQAVDASRDCLVAIAADDEDADQLPKICGQVAAAFSELKNPVKLHAESPAVEKLAEEVGVSTDTYIVDYVWTQAGNSYTSAGWGTKEDERASLICASAVNGTIDAIDEPATPLDTITEDRAVKLLRPAAEAHKNVLDLQGDRRLKDAAVIKMSETCERLINLLAETDHTVTVVS